MIRAFGLLGASELGFVHRRRHRRGDRHGFGLLIAMIALLPFNFLNSRLEQARQEIENAAARLELLL